MDTPTPTLVAGPSAWFENAKDAAGVAGRFARDPYNARAVSPAITAGLGAARDADSRVEAIDRELHADFAARLDGLAASVAMAKLEAVGLSWSGHAATLADIQSFLETMAGEIRVRIL